MNRADEIDRSPLKKPGLIAFILSAATFLLFSPALGYDFINYDDSIYVFKNSHVLQGFSREGLAYAFHSIDGASWMPVTWLSFMLDTVLYGTKPAGYHLTNILLHSVDAGLLFLALQRMTKNGWAALLVAALFAWHPQRLESVVWVSERKDVLSLFFFMLGLLAYLHYVKEPGWRRMTWVAACLILGLMSKPMVVSFPLVLLLLDFWPLGRVEATVMSLRTKAWPLLKEKIPLALICIGIMALTVWSQAEGKGIKEFRFPWYLRFFRMAENVWFYGHTFFSPTGLSLLYRTYALNYLHVLVVGLLLLLITGAVMQQMRSRPWLAVGWFWFLITLAPVSGVIRLGEITVADRYSYLPSVGLAIMVSYAAGAAIAHWPRIRSGVAAGIAAWVMLLMLTTWADLPCWKNNYTIFDNAYRHGAHLGACDQLSSELYQRKEYQQAIVVSGRGIAEPAEIDSLYQTRGASLLQLGELDRAMADFNHVTALNPSNSAAYLGRALVDGQLKKYAEAQVEIQKYHQLGGEMDTSAMEVRPK